MDKKDLKKILAGLSISALMAGAGLAGCSNSANPPPPAHQETGGSG